MMKSAAILALIGLAATATAGCGTATNASGVHRTSASAYTYRPAAANVPACAHAGKAIAFPSHFPHGVPVPSGAIITGTRTPIGGGIAAMGYIPSSSFQTSVHFFPRHFRARGFKVGVVEIDSPHDSEGEYEGHGFLGGWSLKALAGCPGAMALQIEARPGNASS